MDRIIRFALAALALIIIVAPFWRPPVEQTGSTGESARVNVLDTTVVGYMVRQTSNSYREFGRVRVHLLCTRPTALKALDGDCQMEWPTPGYYAARRDIEASDSELRELMATREAIKSTPESGNAVENGERAAQAAELWKRIVWLQQADYAELIERSVFPRLSAIIWALHATFLALGVYLFLRREALATAIVAHQRSRRMPVVSTAP